MKTNNNLMDKCLTALNTTGYCMVTWKGTECPLTPTELEQLKSLAYQVVGIDDMFRTPTFRTMTLVRNTEGFKNLLDMGIMKRYVTDYEYTTIESDGGGTIHVSVPRLVLKLNTEHSRARQFKSRFIGVSGCRIQELCIYLGCKIELR